MSRSSYLQSTAMAVVMATGAFSGVAKAADAVVEPPVFEPPAAQYYFSVEGSVVFAKPSVDKVGYDPDNDVGLYAGVAFGRKITPAWDWRVGLAFTNFEDNDTEGDIGTLTSELRFATADLEAGFAAVENTSTNLRFFGGLRILWEDDSAAGDLFGDFVDSQDDDFLGIGPRIGADFQSRFGDSRFGMSGMVAGAAIWGNRDVDRNFESGPPDESFDDSDEVYNLEGNLGIDYHWSDTSKFTLGYRAQQWWGLRQQFDGSDIDVDEDVLVHGPFLKYVAQF